LLDAASRRRSPATMPGFHAGRAPRNKGQRYAADPPTVDEIVAVMRHARYGDRLNGLIVVLWRAGLRINEAQSLTETDLDERRGSILIRHGKNDRRREVGMDAWGWSALRPWMAGRATLPVGPLFCVIAGPTRGHAWSAGAVRLQLHQLALQAGVRRRFAPRQLRHAHAVELLHEGIPLPLIQRQLRHSHLLHDWHVPTRDLLRGDHLHRPRPARADDARQRRSRPVEHPRERITRSREPQHARPGVRRPLHAQAATSRHRPWRGGAIASVEDAGSRKRTRDDQTGATAIPDPADGKPCQGDAPVTCRRALVSFGTLKKQKRSRRRWRFPPTGGASCWRISSVRILLSIRQRSDWTRRASRW